jgi:NitT/TauT family transport system ATP-binding protein
VIQLEEVSKTYDGWSSRETPALQRANLRVQDGELLCILGPSGCGKSTMLNLVAGFFPPSEGRVLFDGRPVTGPGPDRGVVFQEPTLFPWLTVSENVELGLKAAGISSDERRERSRHWLQMVGLSDAADQVPAALSGGMRQRVALARVLVLRPAALLMDEPFSALDAGSRERLQDELLSLWQAHGQTIMFVTHNVSEAAYLADRVAVMSANPNTVCRVVPVPCERPRDRSGRRMQEITQELRRAAEEAAGPLEVGEAQR